MIENDKNINNLIMQEMGLEVGPAHKIYDQDSGLPIRINGIDVVEPGYIRGRQMSEFDPFNNRKQMGSLFGYFLDKHAEETGSEVVTYYDIPSNEPQKGSVTCVMDDNSKLQSGDYIRDSLRYADIIIQLNGGEANSLQEYDSPIKKETVKKTKGGTTRGRKPKQV